MTMIQLCNELLTLYDAKNSDYGNSFSDLVREYGPIVGIIKIQAKLKRLKVLLIAGKVRQVDESVKDTLIDLAAYALMLIVEIELEKERGV